MIEIVTPIATPVVLSSSSEEEAVLANMRKSLSTINGPSFCNT